VAPCLPVAEADFCMRPRGRMLGVWQVRFTHALGILIMLRVAQGRGSSQG